MLHGNKNTGKDRDAGIKEKSRGEEIAEKKERAQGGDHRLNIEDDVDHCGVAIFQGECEENRSHRRPGESGKNEITPSTGIDFTEITDPWKKERQKHQENEG